MTLPVEPPVEPMLAKLAPEIPRDRGWVYEPKWDGFRAIVFRDRREVRIGSRGGKSLERYFPELVEALGEALPARCVVDGEIVVAHEGFLDFEVLQQRIHPAASRIGLLARETPSSYVAFDLLAQGSRDLRARPLTDRWERLTSVLPPRPTARTMRAVTAPRTAIALTPSTGDPDEAARWFDELEPMGLDGVIAKRLDLPYRPGARVMVKVKHHRTLEAVVAGYRVHKSGRGVGSLLLGLYDDDGVLHHVGATAAFRAAERLRIREMLRPLEGGEGFGSGTVLGGPSRWRPTEKDWIALRPQLVCEVAYDHFQGRRLRHLGQFLRWRPDRDPRDCTFAQARPDRG